MADIFREVDEDVRRDRAVDLWSRYGLYVIAAVVLIVAATAALVGWRHWQVEARRDAAAQYLAAAEGDPSLRIDALAGVADGQEGVYAQMARLRGAAALSADDPAAALAAYDALAAEPDLPARLRALAAIRALVLAADSQPVDEVILRAGPLTDAANPFRSHAREILAVAEMSRGNDAAARAALEQIVADLSAPLSLRERATLLLELVSSTEAGS
ncbi:MAG: tetratricopeptide repeat protein [Alphaproteobacteria bacterium]|nr:tetratricopeptide repeat protein [Alphaproteobacteria bacterium]MDX5369004.1 tetratricopeptide repeat protein [Alphaproteobacteria bacterium]MDX5463704.1 tetratricopeptide repeat protein [Alphaproteobacteria bacterium]